MENSEHRTPLSELWVCGSCKWYGKSEEQDNLGSQDDCCPQCGNEDLMQLDSIVEVMHVCGNGDEIDRLIEENKELTAELEDWRNREAEIYPEIVNSK